jgi:hypothetical protein
MTDAPIDAQQPAGDAPSSPSSRGWLAGRTPRLLLGTVLAGAVASGGYGIASAATAHGSVASSVSARAPRGHGGHGFGGGGYGPMGGFGGGFGFGGLQGLVTATTPGTSISFTEPDGTAETVDVTGTTKYRDGSTTITSVSAGEDIEVRVTKSTASASTPTASSVQVVGPSVTGWVVAVSGDTLTVQDSQGFQYTVNASSATFSKQGATASISNLATSVPYTEIEATGTLVSGSPPTLDASQVTILVPRTAPSTTTSA